MGTQKKLRNSSVRSVLLLGLIASGLSASTACTREDAREGSQDIKQGVHEVGDKVKAGAENLKQEMPEVKQQVKGAANDVGNAIIEAGKEVKETALEARQKVREGIRDTRDDR